MYLIKITKEGKISQAINPGSIISITGVTDDPHGNKYTEITSIGNDVVKVQESLESVISMLEDNEYEMTLTEYEYKFDLYTS